MEAEMQAILLRSEAGEERRTRRKGKSVFVVLALN